MDRETFEELVAQAVDGLPREFAERLDNVAILIDDYPSRSQLRKSRVPSGSTLLGLYEGIPRTRRGNEYGMVLPDKITIFQKPIEAAARSDEAAVKTIRRVVLHEIAHHFGISDARLREIDRY